MYQKLAYKLSTTNICYFRSSENLLMSETTTVIAYRKKKNLLNAVSISDSILECQFLTKKKTNFSGKLLERNIKLLEMRKGNESLKIENYLLEGCQKNSPLLSCSCGSESSLQWLSVREASHSFFSALELHNTYKCLVLGYRSELQFSHSTDVEGRFQIRRCL